MRGFALAVSGWMLMTGTFGCQMFPMKGAWEAVTPAAPPPHGVNAQARLELPATKAAEACIATAQLMEQSGKIDEAIALYEKARQDDPSLTRLTRRLAVLQDARGNFAQADDEYKKALALWPRDADLQNDYGYSHYSRGDWANAETHLREAIKIKPDHARAWVNLGLTLAQQGRRDESLAAFEKQIPRDQALCNYAFIVGSQGRPQDARAIYQEALQFNPANPLAMAAISKLGS